MSYYETQYRKIYPDNDIIVDGVIFPQTSEPIQCTPQLVSEGGRLADAIDFEGRIQGVKHTILLKYNFLNKEWFDKVYNATMRQYELNPDKDMFFQVTVPTYTPMGVHTFTCYLGASSFSNCKITRTTEEMVDILGQSYNRNGIMYDEWHEDVEINFVEK